jgi:hypothetical protein
MKNLMIFEQSFREKPTKKEQLRVLQAQVNEIFREAREKKLTNLELAIEIWTIAVQKQSPHVAIAALMINKVTGFTGKDNANLLSFIAKQTLAWNVIKTQWAVQLIYDGLIINSKENLEEEVKGVLAKCVMVN